MQACNNIMKTDIKYNVVFKVSQFNPCKQFDFHKCHRKKTSSIDFDLFPHDNIGYLLPNFIKCIDEIQCGKPSETS